MFIIALVQRVVRPFFVGVILIPVLALVGCTELKTNAGGAGDDDAAVASLGDGGAVLDATTRDASMAPVVDARDGGAQDAAVLDGSVEPTGPDAAAGGDAGAVEDDAQTDRDVGDACTAPTECRTRTCVEQTCRPACAGSCLVGSDCVDDGDCGEGTCHGGVCRPITSCVSNEDCASAICEANICRVQ